MVRLVLAQEMLERARALENSGHLADAAIAYRQVVSRWPTFGDCWYNLGRIERRLGNFAAALAAYDQALVWNIEQPEEVHLNRAVIYSDCLFRSVDAERELQLALTKNPNYAPALLNLANLREDLGQREAALQLYEQILRVQPNHFEALARFANAQLTSTVNDALNAKLRAAIADPAVAPQHKASLGFALGKRLDHAGDYSAAFAAYVAANKHSAECLPANAFRYSAEFEQRTHQAIRAAFDRRRSLPNSRPDASRPIFICGMFRSGSTLLERVLSGHSRVRSGGELNVLPGLVSRSLQPFPTAVVSASDQQLLAVAGEYLDYLAGTFPGRDYVTDKRPDNFLYIGLIKVLFPDAKIVHTVRNPLDNCLSIFFLHLDQRLSYALDLEHIASHYVAYRELMAHWKALFPADIFDFDYDEFVASPRPAVERLLAYCNLPWESACLEHDRQSGVVKTASHWQVREPLYRRSSGRWRNYAAALAPIVPKLSAYLGTSDER
jgi:predicted TPR repeat methyltransferase